MLDEIKYIDQVAIIVKTVMDGQYIHVVSVHPKEEFKRDGSMYGYRYEWNVNHYSFSKDMEYTMARFGLTEAEYNFWDNLFIERYDKIKGRFYISEAAKTYAALI